MLRVARLTGNAAVSPWVTYCAVAAIGFAIGVGEDAGKEAMAEVSYHIYRIVATKALPTTIAEAFLVGEPQSCSVERTNVLRISTQLGLTDFCSQSRHVSFSPQPLANAEQDES